MVWVNGFIVEKVVIQENLRKEKSMDRDKRLILTVIIISVGF